MGVPIPRYEDEELKRIKGYFSIRLTPNMVGVPARDVFIEQPHLQEVFQPILSFPGSAICDFWAGNTLHFIYGASADGCFFKVKGTSLVFLGTGTHGMLEVDSNIVPQELVLSYHMNEVIAPGFIEFHDWPIGETESDDDEDGGFREVAAVYLGGRAPVLLDLPPCICCQHRMRYLGNLETDTFSEDTVVMIIVLLYCDRCGVQACKSIG